MRKNLGNLIYDFTNARALLSHVNTTTEHIGTCLDNQYHQLKSGFLETTLLIEW